jgi:hypothetical protein
MARKGKPALARRAALSERGNDLYQTQPVAVHALLRVEALPRDAWFVWEAGHRGRAEIQRITWGPAPCG